MEATVIPFGFLLLLILPFPCGSDVGSKIRSNQDKSGGGVANPSGSSRRTSFSSVNYQPQQRTAPVGWGVGAQYPAQQQQQRGKLTSTSSSSKFPIKAVIESAPDLNKLKADTTNSRWYYSQDQNHFLNCWQLKPQKTINIDGNPSTLKAVANVYMQRMGGDAISLGLFATTKCDGIQNYIRVSSTYYNVQLDSNRWDYFQEGKSYQYSTPYLLSTTSWILGTFSDKNFLMKPSHVMTSNKDTWSGKFLRTATPAAAPISRTASTAAPRGGQRLPPEQLEQGAPGWQSRTTRGSKTPSLRGYNLAR